MSLEITAADHCACWSLCCAGEQLKSWDFWYQGPSCYSYEENLPLSDLQVLQVSENI